MSFRDNEEYDKERAFTVQQLSFVTPIVVLPWFNFKAYGVANICPIQQPEVLEEGDLFLHAKQADDFEQSEKPRQPNENNNEGGGHANHNHNQHTNQQSTTIK